MSAYVIVDVDIHDLVRYEQYKKLTPASIAPYGGKFIVRGNPTETLEGNWKPNRFVIISFPSLEKAKEWWSSAEYAPAKSLRQEIATTNMIVVEGI